MAEETRAQVTYPVTVELLILVLEDGGEKILPTVAEMDKKREAVEIEFDAAEEERCEAKTPEARATAEAKVSRARYLRVLLSRNEQTLVELRKRATVERFVIQTPSYNGILDLQAAATEEIGGMEQVDMRKLRAIAQPLAFAGSGELRPPVADKLWMRWMAEVYPSEDDLPNW